MHFLSLGFLVAVCVTVQSAVIPSTHVVHEKRDVTSKIWTRRETIPPEAILPIRIGLKQRNLHRGSEFLMDVSHPVSSSYAKHWTSEEVINMFAPEPETVFIVHQWLVESGIHPRRITHSDNKGWLAFDGTAEETGRLLHTKYYLYEHETGQVAPATESYHVPKHIQAHIDYITPGIKLLAADKRGHPKRGFGVASSGGPNHQGHDSIPIKTIIPGPEGFPKTAAGNLSGCDKYITPDCIRALYKIPLTPDYGYDGRPRNDNALGVFEMGDFYAQEDLDIFFANFSSWIPNGTHPTPAFINGATAPVPVSEAGGESALDFQLILPLIYPQKTTLYQTDDLYYSGYAGYKMGAFNTLLDALDGSYCNYSAFGETGNDPVLDPTYPDTHVSNGYKGQLMCGTYKPANVISVSYGGQESDLPNSYQQRQCNEFMKLGLQGISILYASGDDGVGGPPSFKHHNGCLGKNGTVFSPAWPNNCPYLTNVGATKVYPNHTVFDPESAANDPVGHPYQRAFSSGGGFSNIYPIPDYQADAVSHFFSNHNPPYKYYSGNATFNANGGLYNRIGRGYPDVSANGDNIAMYTGGEFMFSGGTSASTPIFASVINRINELRLNAGKNTLGFLNPALYSNPDMLNDITNGTNPGCGTVGFSAVPGWDPVTGLGTPNYPKMVEFFMGLP